MNPDALGWIGNIIFIIGAIFLARNNAKNSMKCNVGANIIYIAVGIWLNTSSLAVLSMILASINGYGIYNLRRQNATRT